MHVSTGFMMECFFYLTICLLTYLSIYIPIYVSELSIYLFIYLFIYLSIYLSIRPFTSHTGIEILMRCFIFLSMRLFKHSRKHKIPWWSFLSIYLLIYLFIYPIHISIRPLWWHLSIYILTYLSIYPIYISIRHP